jgi:hypothetical protein
MAWWDHLPKVHYTEAARSSPDSPIYHESQTYRRELPRLLAEGAEGRFALIKGDEVIGLFADEDEAMRVGREKYLMQPFLVQPILEWEPVVRQLRSRVPCRTLPSR